MHRTIEAVATHSGTLRKVRREPAKMELMKAIRIHNYGGPDVLKYEDAPRPLPQTGEVLVRVHAAGVNPFDWQVRAGYMKEFVQHKLPVIPGWDVSGIVEEIGPEVSEFKRGDEVYGKLDPKYDGAYAEYVLACESEIAVKPKSLYHVRAAAVPILALTAWQSLFGAQSSSDRLAEIGKLIDSGKFKVVLDRILPLSEARRAHELIQSGQVRGTIVLRVKDVQP
jgi:NADPH:quinone reductase-like Zn-dependent oxidoreductase